MRHLSAQLTMMQVATSCGRVKKYHSNRRERRTHMTSDVSTPIWRQMWVYLYNVRREYTHITSDVSTPIWRQTWVHPYDVRREYTHMTSDVSTPIWRQTWVHPYDVRREYTHMMSTWGSWRNYDKITACLGIFGLLFVGWLDGWLVILGSR